jgi:hypothetical protein
MESERDLESRWCNASRKGKVDLYKRHPDRQKFFMNLPGDKVYLLSQLPSQEAINAYKLIEESSIRTEILRCLTSESKGNVEARFSKFCSFTTELVEGIARMTEDLWEFACTNKRNFAISAHIWVQTIKNNGDIAMPTIALRCMSIWAPDDCRILASSYCELMQTRIIESIVSIELAGGMMEIVTNLPSRVGVPNDSFLGVVETIRTEVVYAIEDSNPYRAKDLLKLVEKLPANTKVSEDSFLNVVTAIHARVIHALEDRIDYKLDALTLIKLLPPNTKIPENTFLDVVTAIRTGVLQNIKAFNIDRAGWLLGLMELLPSETQIPKHSFLDVVTAIQAEAVRSIEALDVTGARRALQLIEYLPSNTHVLEDGFPDIAIAIRTLVIKAMRDDPADRSARKALGLFQYLPPKTILSDDFFLDIVSEIRDYVVRSIRDDHIVSAGLMLRLTNELPSNTSITTDCFFDVATAIRDRAVQANEDGKTSRARFLLKLMLKLPPNTTVPHDFFLGVANSSTASLIRQPIFNTRVPDDFPPPVQMDPKDTEKA